MILMGLVAFIIVDRWLIPQPPFGVDVMAYAVIGHEWLEGKPLYSDLWDQKPPLIFITYALAEIAVGYAPQMLVLLNTVAPLITLFGAYRAGKAGGGKAAGLWAAAFWAVLSGAFIIEGRDPNSESFINPCVMWAFALLVEAKDRLPGVKRALIIGGLFAVGSFYKPVVVAAALLLAGIHVVLPPEGSKNRVWAVRDAFIIGAVGIIGWCAMFGYFAATNRFEVSYDAIITYNRYYAGDVISNLTLPLREVSKAKFILMNLLGVGLLFAAWLRFVKDRRSGALFAALVVSTWVMVASPGKFYAHYFQLWLVPLVVGAGWTIVWFVNHSPARFRRLPPLLGALTLALLFLLQVPFYKNAFARKWADDSTILNLHASEPLGREIDRLLAPDETFFLWGSEPGLYFWSRRQSPTGLFFIQYLFDNPLAAQLSMRVASDLARTRPELLIISKKAAAAFAAPPAWLTADYVPLPTYLQPDTHLLLARRGGNLEVRAAGRTDNREGR